MKSTIKIMYKYLRFLPTELFGKRIALSNFRLLDTPCTTFYFALARGCNTAMELTAGYIHLHRNATSGHRREIKSCDE